MFRHIPATIRFSSERVLVFVRFMRLCNNGEISSSVVLIITTIKRRAWGGGVFCNVGIVLTWGAMVTLVSIFVAAALCGIPAYCLSIIDVYRRWALDYGLCGKEKGKKNVCWCVWVGNSVR